MAISLIGVNSRYVQAQNGGGAGVIAAGVAPSTWERFNVNGTLAHGAQIQLQASNNQWVCADGGGGGAVTADRSTPSTWETFTVVRAAGAGTLANGDRFALQTADGLHYLCAEDEGESRLNATRTSAGSWETFIFEGQPGRLRRGVSLGVPKGGSEIGGPQTLAADYNATPTAVLNDYRATNTRWCRLFVYWPALQPRRGDTDPATDTEPYSSGSPYPSWAGSPSSYVAALDSQLNVARNAGLQVIMCLYGFPYWVNEGTSYSPGTDLFPGFYAGTTGGTKPREYRVPADGASSTSYWGKIVEWIIARYRRRIHFFEPVNEPNYQWYPQVNSSGDRTIACLVGQMIQTAAAKVSAYGGWPRLLVPSASDWHSDRTEATSWSTFIGSVQDNSGLLGALKSNNFTPTPNMGFSHHNYRDVAENRSGGQTYAHAVRARLLGYWSGYPFGDANSPELFITEGGAAPQTVALLYGYGDLNANPQNVGTVYSLCRDLMHNNWVAMGGQGATSDSPGIRMLTTYLFTAGAQYETALRDPNGTARPVYGEWQSENPSW